MNGKVFLALTLCMSSLSAAEVYRSFDAQGNAVYSDRPEDRSAVAVTIRVDGAAAPARTRVALAAARNTANPVEPPAAAQPDQRTIEAAEAAQAREDRAANCAIARERSERFDTSHRLYNVTEGGEREYLDDAAIDNARNDARAEVARWCN